MTVFNTENGTYSGKQLWVVIIMIALMIMAASTQSCRQKPDNRKRSFIPSKVDVYKVHEEPFSVTVNTTGSLLPCEETEIRSGVSGHVVKIFFKEGQKVSKGDLLVVIDHRTWDARRRGLEARLTAAISELKRGESLLPVEGISVSEYEQTASEVASLEAQIEELEVMTDLAQIRAPFDGRIGFRDFSTGAYISQGALITRLVKSDKLKVVFSIPARHIHTLSRDHKILVTSSSTGKTAEARVFAIDPVVDSGSGSIELRAYLDNSNEEFIPGDFVQVELAVQQNSNAILIPAEAIVSELNNQIVYTVREGKATRKVVKTGSRTREKVQIISGLSPGDMVITTGLMVIKEGDIIKTGNIINDGKN